MGGGYLIMPADKRVEPILAYSNKGYFSYNSNLPYGLTNWLTVNDKNMQLLRKNTALKVPPGVAKLWAELAAADSGSTKVVNQRIPPPPPCQDTYSSQTVGPLLQTTWGQGQPYNYLCPAGTYDGYHKPTGCVATAMAQVMYYWKTPATYNWGIMPLTYNNYGISYRGNLDVSQLMLDVGSSVDMLYHDPSSNGTGGSYPAPFNLVPPRIGPISCTTAFKNTFGYGSSTEGNFDWNRVVSNLNIGEPVLLSGDTNTEGHEWVCDGWEQENYNWCPSNGSPGGGESWLYLDMNWGWDNYNNCDGWYDFNYWSVLNGSTVEYFQYNMAMTYNIHP